MITVLYPSDDFEYPADIYLDEERSFRDSNVKTAIFDFNEFFDGRLKIKPKFDERKPILYRGWMLTDSEYRHLYQFFIQKKYQLFTTPEQYLKTHFLPNWYDQIKEFTPKTVFTNNLNEVEKIYHQFGEQSVFVKDFVKSDTTNNSIANSLEEVHRIIDNIKKFRGKIDGGICLREVIQLNTESEERFFIFQKQAFARDGNVPKIVKEIAQRIDSPFFSIDTCFDINGKLWVIELGDGQASDIKKWQVDDFVKIFCS